MAEQSISSAFAERAARDPNEIVIIDAAGATTAAELDRRATQLARVLLRQGVQRNDLVELALTNSAALIVASVAIWRVGATPMPIDPAMDPAERAELETLARPSACFGVPSPHHWIPTVQQSAAQLESTDPVPDAWADCWKAPVTSGSTGTPKVVAATAPARVDPERPLAPIIPKDAVQLVCTPMCYATGFTYALRGLMTGHRLVIMAEFDERQFLELVPQHRITWAVLSPPSIRRLVRVTDADRKAYDMSSLQSVMHIGGRCPTADKRALIEWLSPDRVAEVYAGTESNGITWVSGEDWLAHPGTVGNPVDGTSISIRRDDGTEAVVGEIGTVWMHRGERPYYRYLGAPSQRTADGWDTLGDLGYVDNEGRLYVVDRAVDIIQLGDATLYPADVEEAVEELTPVRGAVAFTDRSDGGDDTISLLVDIGYSRLSVQAIRDHLIRRLGKQAAPTRIILTSKHIRNDAGKIRRRALSGCGLSRVSV